MRLIDAEALEEIFEERIAGIETNGGAIVTIFKTSMEVLLKDVKSQPTIEAKPVIHAHWGKHGECSNCGAYAKCDDNGEYSDDYCHSCGAQMDEGVKIPVISMEDVPKLMREGD